MTSTLRITNGIALLGYFGLIIGIYVWHMWINKTPDYAISIMLIIQLGPLLFPLRGLLNGKAYTHAWSMYLAIFYFVIGVWYAGADTELFFGMYIVACSMIFFTGTLLYTRYAGKSSAGNNSGA